MQIILLFKSSIGRKVLMSLSGLFYCFFLVGHLAGNFLLYVGKEKFNNYADFLSNAKWIYIAEVILVLALVVHIVTAISLTRENRRARGSTSYKNIGRKGKIRSNSTTMALSGLLILAFVVLHVYTFKFGDWNNQTENTLYDLVLTRFADFWYSALYVFFMICLGLHLNHAFKSAFHTLGLVPQQTPWLTRFSTSFAVLLTISFSSFPIYFYFSQKF